MAETAVAIVDTLSASGYLRKMVDPAEIALLEQIRNGDDASFELLVKEHTSRLISLAWRLVGNRDDAEELTQEAFLRLHRSLPGFRGESSIGTWLYRTTTRLAIDHLRRERLKRKLFFFRQSNEAPDPVEMASDQRRDPGREYQEQETMMAMRKSLQKLSTRQQVIFTLRHYEGLPLKEIAEALGLQTGTVKAHLHRAITQLRQDLSEFREAHS